MYSRRPLFTYVLPAAPERGISGHVGHRFGVNQLILSDNADDCYDKGSLWSAGRDGSIRCWDTTDGSCRHVLQGHTDWVTDICVMAPSSFNERELVVSASNDGTLRLWSGPGFPEMAAHRVHTDYVSCLAWARNTGTVISGGLDAVLHVWDVEEAMTVGQYVPPDIQGHHASVYCVDTTPDGQMAASGSTERLVRLWDTRTQRQICKLRGHRDNVRVVALSDDGRRVVSGGSDRTVRVWDTRTMRCLRSFAAVHGDSVFSLHACDADLSSVITASRDGSVSLIRTQEGMAFPLMQQEGLPLLALAADRSAQYLWTASTRPDIYQWDLQSLQERATEGGRRHGVPGLSGSMSLSLSLSRSPSSPVPSPPPSSASWNPRSSSPSASLSLSRSKDGSDADPPSPPPPPSHPSPQPSSSLPLHPPSPSPLMTITGRPAICEHRLLNTKREAVTQDTSGRIVVWDLIHCRIIADYYGEETDLETVVQQHQQQVSVPNWCSLECRFGRLGVTLDRMSCFKAAVYGDTLGLEGGREEELIVVAQAVIRGLMEPWRRGQAEESEKEARNTRGDHINNINNLSDNNNNNNNNTNSNNTNSNINNNNTNHSDQKENTDHVNHDTQGNKEQDTSSSYSDSHSSHDDPDEDMGDGPPVFTIENPQHIDIVFTYGMAFPHRVPVRIPRPAFTGGELIPQWVADTLAVDVAPADAKIGFYLRPATIPTPSSGGKRRNDASSMLPFLPHDKARLLAQRTLRIRRVAWHVVTKLELLREPSAEDAWRAVVVECEGRTCPPEMDLGTVDAFMKTPGNDLVLTYRRRPRSGDNGEGRGMTEEEE